MKRYALASICGSLLAIAALAQEQQPSLSETTRWIRSTLATHGNCIEKTSGQTDSYRIESILLDDCVLRTKCVTELTRSTISVDASMRISDVERIEVVSASKHWLINLYAKKDSVKAELDATLLGYHEVNKVAMSSLQLPCDDEEVAGRVRKALLHLIELCGKRKEPF